MAPNPIWQTHLEVIRLSAYHFSIQIRKKITKMHSLLGLDFTPICSFSYILRWYGSQHIILYHFSGAIGKLSLTGWQILKLKCAADAAGELLTLPQTLVGWKRNIPSSFWLVWRSGNGVCHINEVKLRRARLVLRLVTTFVGSTIPVIYPGHSGPLSLAIPP